LENSPQSNPKQPINNADPARVAYHYRANIVNKEQWDAKVLKVKVLLEQLDKSVKELEEFSFLVGVEHEHNMQD